jgi:hypothetical protein
VTVAGERATAVDPVLVWWRGETEDSMIFRLPVRQVSIFRLNFKQRLLMKRWHIYIINNIEKEGLKITSALHAR